MYLNKKGDMQYGILVSLIALLAVFVVFVLFAKFFGGWLSETNQDQICKTSIFAAAQTKKIPTITGRGEPLISLKCPRKEIVIKKSQVVEGGKINQDKAAKIIADEMYKCWDKVGAGKIDPFSQWDVKGESYCLICGYVKFDQALIDFMNQYGEGGKNNDIYIHSPVDYLKNKNVPNSGITYYEYFYKERAPVLSNEDLVKLGSTGVLPNSLILVQMYKKEGRSTWKIAITGILIVGAIIAGIFTGGATWIVALIVITAAGFSTASIVYIGNEAFADCPDCNAIGGIQLVPPNAELNMKVTVNLDGKQKEIPFCTKLVN
ncbi:MAG: hypothetical protein AABX29_02040 [Nanoarchaeota archaeon]